MKTCRRLAALWLLLASIEASRVVAEDAPPAVVSGRAIRAEWRGQECVIRVVVYGQRSVAEVALAPDCKPTWNGKEWTKQDVVYGSRQMAGRYVLCRLEQKDGKAVKAVFSDGSETKDKP